MRLAPMAVAIGNLIDFGASVDFTYNSASATGTAGYEGIAPGTVVQAAPTTPIISTAGVPNWIGSELMWAVNTSANAFIPGSVVSIDKNCSLVAAASTAGLGIPLYVCITNFAVGSTTAQGGWIMRRGICPALFSVAATTGPVYIGTTGVLTPTAANGKQLLNATTIIAAATTFTRTGQTLSGSSLVKFSTTQGMFPGQAISGTGIPASSVVSSVNADGTSVSIGSAIGTLVTATATGSVTVTLTPTGYGIIQIDNAFSQGQAV